MWYGGDHYLFAKALEVGPYYQRNLGALQKFAERHPGQADVMIVPSASLVLEEKLPWRAPIMDEDAYLDEVGAKLDGLANVYDMRGVLAAHKDEYIFYRTDHHWTTDGAFYAYEAYAQANGLPVFDRCLLYTSLLRRVHIADIAALGKLLNKGVECVLFKIQLGVPPIIADILRLLPDELGPRLLRLQTDAARQGDVGPEIQDHAQAQYFAVKSFASLQIAYDQQRIFVFHERTSFLSIDQRAAENSGPLILGEISYLPK